MPATPSPGRSSPAVSNHPGKQANPFRKPEAIKPTIMALVSGAEGVGKTYCVLKDAPRPLAVIDSEGAAQFYVGRKGFEPFELIHTKSYRELMAALDYIEANPDAYATLAIDSVTVFYSVLQDAAVASRTARVVAAGGDPADVDIEMREWGRIKRLHKALMARLMNLPLNVLVTAREKDLMEKRGNEFVKIGVKPDADKGIGYDFALTIRITKSGGKRLAVVTKDWSGVHGADAEIPDPAWSNLFAPLLARGGNAKATRAVQSDEAAAHEDSTSMGTRLATPLEAQALAEAMTSAGYDPEEVRERKGWPPLGEMGAVRVAELVEYFHKKAKPESVAAPAQLTEQEAASHVAAVAANAAANVANEARDASLLAAEEAPA